MNIAIVDKLAFTPEQIARLKKFGTVASYDDFPDTGTAAERS